MAFVLLLLNNGLNKTNIYAKIFLVYNIQKNFLCHTLVPRPNR